MESRNVIYDETKKYDKCVNLVGRKRAKLTKHVADKVPTESIAGVVLLRLT